MKTARQLSRGFLTGDVGVISLDALTGIVWEDDSQIVEMSVRKEYDKKNPRIEFEVRAI